MPGRTDPPAAVTPAQMEHLLAGTGLTLNAGQMADLVMAWRQVAGLIASIPRAQAMVDDQAFSFRLPPPPAAAPQPRNAKAAKPAKAGKTENAGKTRKAGKAGKSGKSAKAAKPGKTAHKARPAAARAPKPAPRKPAGRKR